MFAAGADTDKQGVSDPLGRRRGDCASAGGGSLTPLHRTVAVRGAAQNAALLDARWLTVEPRLVNARNDKARQRRLDGAKRVGWLRTESV